MPGAPFCNTRLPAAARARDLVSRLTLSQKAQQLSEREASWRLALNEAEGRVTAERAARDADVKRLNNQLASVRADAVRAVRKGALQHLGAHASAAAHRVVRRELEELGSRVGAETDSRKKKAMKLSQFLS